MELSERWIETFENEGFSLVYDQQGTVNKYYDTHTNENRVSIFVTDGSITFHLPTGTEEISANQRFDIPVSVPYTAHAGPQGWIGVVAEMSPHDSPF